MICIRPPGTCRFRRENAQRTAKIHNDGHQNSVEKKFQRTLSKKILKNGNIHSIAENTKLWLCAIVRLEQCLYI